MQVISILEQHADATVAGGTIVMAISAMLTLMATLTIVAAAWSTARGTKQLAKIAEREITMIWPDSPETAPSIDVLMPGEKFEMTLGGPSLVAPDKKLYPHVKTETPMKPFDVEVRFRNMIGEDMGERTYTCEVPKLRNIGGRVTHPMHRIADALEKATGGPKSFGESSEIGQPASEVDKLQRGKEATQA